MTPTRPLCHRCERPANVRALYARANNGQARLIGRLGRACFYIVAAAVARGGEQPERENARPVRLRGVA